MRWTDESAIRQLKTGEAGKRTNRAEAYLWFRLHEGMEPESVNAELRAEGRQAGKPVTWS